MSVKEDVCAICDGARSSRKDQIIYCDGDGCDIPVHQSCYGVEVIPEGDWFCQRCEDDVPVDDTNIICCSFPEGALKRTVFKNSYMHVVCAMWNKDISHNIEPYKFTLPKVTHKCIICKESDGICAKCEESGCEKYFHITCAIKSGIIHLNGILQQKPSAFCKDHRKILVIEDSSDDDDNAMQDFINKNKASIRLEEFQNKSSQRRPQEDSFDSVNNKRLRIMGELGKNNHSEVSGESSESRRHIQEDSEIPLFEPSSALTPVNKFQVKHPLGPGKHKLNSGPSLKTNIPPQMTVVISKPKQPKDKHREVKPNRIMGAPTEPGVLGLSSEPLKKEPLSSLPDRKSASPKAQFQHAQSTEHPLENPLETHHTKQHTPEEYQRAVSQLKKARQEVFRLRKFKKTTAEVFSKLNGPPARGILPTEDSIERYVAELSAILERTGPITDYERAKLQHHVDIMLTKP
ncbi:hypothetical protein CLU79DRAFT_380169 [Phycomyces nitens]|nr:hypothetical protein CLU79DRAFT_380169 [Phycomyces nitens]